MSSSWSTRDTRRVTLVTNRWHVMKCYLCTSIMEGTGYIWWDDDNVSFVLVSWREQATFDEMMIMLSLYWYHGENRLHLMRWWCPYYLPVLPCFGGWNHIFYLKDNSSQVWCTYHLANQFRRRITKYGKTDRGECLKKEDPSQDLDFQCHISWPSLCSVS